MSATSAGPAPAQRWNASATVHVRTYVLDTSVLLADPGALGRFAEHEVVLPVVVITELEGKRHHPELGFFARTALRMLDELRVTHGRLDEPVPGRRRRRHAARRAQPHRPRLAAVGLPARRQRHPDPGRRPQPGQRGARRHPGLQGPAAADQGLRGRPGRRGVPRRRRIADSDTGYTGMAELEVAAAELDELYDDGILDLAEARDLPCHTGPGAALRPGYGAGPGRRRTSRCTWCAATGRRSASTAAPPSSGSRWRCCSTPRSASSRSAAGPAPASRRWRCAPGLEAVMERRQHQKVVVFRPLYAVGGQELGYLPGSESEKMSPWAQAVFDTLGAIDLPRRDRGGARPRDARGAAADPHPRPVPARRLRDRRRGPVAGAQRAADRALADRGQLQGGAHPRRRPARQPAGRAGTTAWSRWSRSSRATRCSPTSR